MSSSPFCGPQPCQWRCREFVPPPECTWCNDPVPQTMLIRGTWTPASLCTDCDSFPIDFILPFEFSGGIPETCEWGYSATSSDAYIWPCAGDPSDVQVGYTLGIFQTGIPATIRISLIVNWLGAAIGSAQYDFDTGQTDSIDCTAEYTLAFTTQSGTPFCTVPTEYILNPAT